jgi:DNA-binding transcriptional ArsR family regulator
MVIVVRMKAFAALADPSRRRIVEMLLERDQTAGDLGAPFKMSQPAVSKHLKVLREAGLVHARRLGRRRLYRLNSAPLADADAWFSRYRNRWLERPRLTPLQARYPVRERDDGSACGRRLRFLGLVSRTNATAAA